MSSDPGGGQDGNDFSAAPLKGFTVLELSTLISGPYCATLLGDMGAEVI